MLENPIYQETFCIKEARIRATKDFPLPRPFHDATMGPFETFSLTVLSLKDKDGIESEIPINGSISFYLETIILPILLKANETSYQSLIDKLYWNIRNEGFRGGASVALGQLDMLLYILAAKKANKPLHRYLGSKRDWAYVYASGGGTNLTEKELIEEMTSFVEQGYKVLKMKVGQGKNMKADAARIQMVRKHIGPDIQLSIDSNQVWTSAEAIEFSKMIEESNLVWFEEPVHSASLEELKQVCEHSKIPIAVGESERSGKITPSLIETGIKHLQVIPGYLSTMQEWLTAATLASKHNIMLSSGGFSQVNCQWIATANETAYTEFLIPVVGALDHFFEMKPAIADGRFLLSQEPGVSIKINWDLIQKKDLIKTDKFYSCKTI